jgi:hypothetical protein
VTSIEEETFSECYNLTSITIPNSVISIGEAAFDECYKLSPITIPNSVTSIGAGAFARCASLISVTIPDSVTVIENSTFSGCLALTTITIPNSVTSIEDWVFGLGGCANLKTIFVQNPIPPKAKRDAFYNLYTDNVRVYVPISGIFAYRAADGWKEFKHIRVIVTRELTVLGILAALILSATAFVVIKKILKSTKNA